MASKLSPTSASQPSRLLGSSKQAVDFLLGKPVMARGLLGLTARGEKAYAYTQAADDIIVGFFDDVARYMAVVRRRGPLKPYSAVETQSLLALNGPASAWTIETQEPPPVPARRGKAPARISTTPALDTFFIYNAANAPFEMLGWQPGGKAIAFFFAPAWPSQLPIVLSEWQVLKAIG